MYDDEEIIYSSWEIRTDDDEVLGTIDAIDRPSALKAYMTANAPAYSYRFVSQNAMLVYWPEYSRPTVLVASEASLVTETKACGACGHEHDEHDEYGECEVCNCLGWTDH